MAEETGRIINNTQIKKIRAYGFATCRQTVTINHHPEILQIITHGVR